LPASRTRQHSYTCTAGEVDIGPGRNYLIGKTESGKKIAVARCDAFIPDRWEGVV